MSSFVLTEEDKGKTIFVCQADQVVVALEENPTTGYRWAIDKLDSTILVPGQVSFSQSPSGGIGGGGRRLFPFDVKGSGTVDLQFKLWREWEGDSSIIDWFNVTIQVQGSSSQSNIL